MNRDKYEEVAQKNIRKCHMAQSENLARPEDWQQTKGALQTFIQDMDELHEVYTAENKKG